MNKESNIVTDLVSEANQKRMESVNKYGNVPVFYAPKRQWLNKLPEPGLSHFIEQASTEDEVNKLLERGRTQFKNASPKTLRKWERIAKQRITELRSSK